MPNPLDMTPAGLALTAFLGFFLLIAFFKSINVADQYERAVVFRLGKYVGLRGPGLFFMIPFFEWKEVIDTRVKTITVSGQEAISRDNVPVKTTVAIWYRIADPAKSVLEVKDVERAVTQLALTKLRSKIGEHNLDESLKNQASLANELKTSVDTLTENWGVVVEQVQLSQVEIPISMQRAMAQEAEAIREQKARVIKADAEFQAAQKLQEAAETIARNPVALELRRMQMIQEVGAEQNTSTIILMPSEFVTAAGALASAAGNFAAGLASKQAAAPAPAPTSESPPRSAMNGADPSHA